MGNNVVITIGREFGSGGREIGKKVADRLGIKFYDKELLQEAAKESGFCREIFENQDEKPTNSFLYSLVMDTYSINGYSSAPFLDMPLNHKVFLAQFETIKKIAEKESCVIVGRCADYALAENPNCINVFIHADKEFRTKRVAAELQVNESKAKDAIQKLRSLVGSEMCIRDRQRMQSRKRINSVPATTITIPARNGATQEAII